jgi:hypothetical protein
MGAICSSETLTFNGLHTVISQKITSAVRTSNPTEYIKCSILKLFLDGNDERYLQGRESAQNNVSWVQLLRKPDQDVGGLYTRTRPVTWSERGHKNIRLHTPTFPFIQIMNPRKFKSTTVFTFCVWCFIMLHLPPRVPSQHFLSSAAAPIHGPSTLKFFLPHVHPSVLSL